MESNWESILEENLKRIETMKSSLYPLDTVAKVNTHPEAKEHILCFNSALTLDKRYQPFLKTFREFFEESNFELLQTLQAKNKRKTLPEDYANFLENEQTNADNFHAHIETQKQLVHHFFNTLRDSIVNPIEAMRVTLIRELDNQLTEYTAVRKSIIITLSEIYDTDYAPEDILMQRIENYYDLEENVRLRKIERQKKIDFAKGEDYFFDLNLALQSALKNFNKQKSIFPYVKLPEHLLPKISDKVQEFLTKEVYHHTKITGTRQYTGLTFKSAKKRSSNILNGSSDISMIAHWIKQMESGGVDIQPDAQNIMRSSAKSEKQELKRTLRLVYQGSRHGFQKSSFIKRVGLRHPTVTLIKTTKGLRFGGYSDVAFSQGEAPNASPNLFLFSLDRSEKFDCNPDNVDYGVYAGLAEPEVMFIFGFNELCVYNDCNLNKNSKTRLGYKEKGIFSGPKGEMGAILNNGEEHFRVAEIEVFVCTD